MKVKSLMNEEKDEHTKNYIEQQLVNYGDEVEITKEYSKMPTFKNMIRHNLIEMVIEEKKENGSKDTKE